MRWFLRIRQICYCELHLNALTNRRAAKDIGRYSYQEKTEGNIKGGIQKWRMVRK